MEYMKYLHTKLPTDSPLFYWQASPFPRGAVRHPPLPRYRPFPQAAKVRELLRSSRGAQTERPESPLDSSGHKDRINYLRVLDQWSTRNSQLSTICGTPTSGDCFPTIPQSIAAVEPGRQDITSARQIPFGNETVTLGQASFPRPSTALPTPAGGHTRRAAP